MITKFKIYEKLENKPELGDYVIVSILSDLIQTYNDDEQDFIENHIGKIVEIIKYPSTIYYAVEYDIPKNFVPYPYYRTKYLGWRPAWQFERKDLKYISKNKEDLEDIIIAKKYGV